MLRRPCFIVMLFFPNKKISDLVFVHIWGFGLTFNCCMTFSHTMKQIQGCRLPNLCMNHVCTTLWNRKQPHVGAPLLNYSCMHATDTFVQLGQIPGLDIEVKLIPMIVAVMLAALLAHSNLAVIVSGGVGKNGSTVAVSYGLISSCQFAVSMCLEYKTTDFFSFCL